MKWHASLIWIKAALLLVIALLSASPEARTPMKAYRVMFFKTLTNSYGKVFEVCQRAINVSSARNAGHAVKQAKRRFEQCENISDWRIRADYFQVDVLSGPSGVVRAETPAFLPMESV